MKHALFTLIIVMSIIITGCAPQTFTPQTIMYFNGSVFLNNETNCSIDFANETDYFEKRLTCFWSYKYFKFKMRWIISKLKSFLHNITNSSLPQNYSLHVDSLFDEK